jgi:hypothetical protein
VKSDNINEEKSQESFDAKSQSIVEKSKNGAMSTLLDDADVTPDFFKGVIAS